jgi:hypothetical protein
MLRAATPGGLLDIGRTTRIEPVIGIGTYEEMGRKGPLAAVPAVTHPGGRAHKS